ncbi:basic membrane protein-domain-containing protein [Catenaria anguillulae PL171]|uniref:Basic membrane protein-domain-containing protein n=1 Tax=Catenaria anguillulae PL171 TaxID=765915 RepID=A0A1Y2I4P8_9FUNG|nr:basic membrane protein-domain-containing protein [Catenaria anguillulae PL171]
MSVGRVNNQGRLPCWVVLLAGLALVLANLVLAQQQLKVHVITNTDPVTTPFSGAAMRGCTDLATDGSVRCRNTIMAGFNDAAALAAAWEAVINGGDDEVFIGASFSFAGVAATLSPKYPLKVFVVVDSNIKPNDQKNTIGIVFAEDQAGFLAGALAGVFTNTRRVGVVGGIPFPPVKRFVNGFIMGAISVCPTCEAYSQYVPSFGSAALGIAAADNLLARGVDTLFGAGGGMGSQAILRAATQGAWAIGVDTDESQTTFRNRAEVSQLLSSALKRADTAVKTAIDYVKRGQRGGFNLVLDASLDGVGLADLVTTAQRNFSTEVTVAIKTTGDSCATTTFSPRSTVLNLIRSSLQRRMISTGVSSVTGDLQPLSAAANKTWYDQTPWGERNQMLPNHQGHSAVVISENRILVWGGQNQFAEFPQHMLQFDFDRYSWSRVAGATDTRPTGRMFHAMGHDSVSNSMFIFGGQTAIVNGNLAAAVLGDTWKYDVTARTWSQVNTPSNGAPSARTNMAHAVLGRNLYVFGGISSTGMVQGDLWRFDMGASTWSQVSATGSVPPALQHATLAPVNGTSLILYGGALASTENSNTLYILDVSSNSWRIHKPSILSSGPPPAAERMRAISVDSRRVLFTGGITAQGVLNTTWVWKMDEDKWDPSAYGPLPGGLHSHALVSLNQSAFANACAFRVDTTNVPTCTPQSVHALLAISGVTNRPGGGVSISFANPDPPPPPVGTVDAGAKWGVTVINIIGIAIGVLLVGFVLKNRTHKAIKAANPPFCLIILFGAILAHIGLIGSGWDPEQRSGSMQTAFLLGGGYVLMFSALVTKIYLVYSIFTSKRIVKRKMSRYYAVTFFAFLIQMLLAGLWYVFDSQPVVTLNIAGTVWFIRSMDSNWVVLCSMPVVVLTLFGLFFAFKTRSVQSQFNEGQYVAMATYAIALTLLIVGTVTLLLQQPLVQYIIAGILTSLTTLAVQLIFFVPKVQASTTASQQALRCKYCKQMIATTSSVTGGGTASSPFSATGKQRLLANTSTQMPVRSVSTASKS